MEPISKKSRGTALVLAVLFGVVGVHRFYVGKAGTGILQILCWFFTPLLALWVLIDIIMIAAGGFKDSQNALVAKW